MSYLVLARKWRPQTFADLVGQEHVSRTLANAIASGRVAHAFLFTGVRGVGKTTSARIMAKALNCQKGPTATPCLECSPCKEIAAGSDVDVQEIDGASYNGVDEVRKLQETLPYRPARDRFKIFIVDEVHMLSASAWNAFLKTLEEPPPHVKFLFATTEVHKVPITILSRCQRYDFKLIASQLIGRRMRYVLEREGIQADDAAIAMIAREAAGSLRDAMSLLDQAIAWSGERLVGEEVSRVLGVAGRAVLERLAQALVQGDGAACLHVVAELAEQGFDIAHVARDILAYLRDLVVAKVCKDPQPLLDCADDEAAGLLSIARAADTDDLIRLEHGFSRDFDDIARTAQPRAALEMSLVRLARRPPLMPIDELTDKLADLERRLGAGPQPGGPGSARPSRGPQGGGGGPQGSAGPARPATHEPPGGRARTSGGPVATSPRTTMAGGAGSISSVSVLPTTGPTATRGGPMIASKPTPESPFVAPSFEFETRGGALATAPRVAPEPCPPPASVRSLSPSSPSPASPRLPAWLASGPPTPASAPAPARTPTGNATSAIAPVHLPSASAPPGPLTAPPFAAATPPHEQTASAPPAERPAASAVLPSESARSVSSPPAESGPAVQAPVQNNADLSAWRAILGQLRTARPPLAAVLEHAAPLSCGPERVVLGYEPESFFAMQAMDEAAVDLLTRTVRTYFGSPTQVEFDLSTACRATPSVAAMEQVRLREQMERAKKAVAEHPLVRATIEILGAELREIRLPE